MYQIIDGKTVSAYVKQQVKDEVAKLSESGSVPALAVIIVGNDPASKVYVANKEKAIINPTRNAHSVFIYGGFDLGENGQFIFNNSFEFVGKGATVGNHTRRNILN